MCDRCAVMQPEKLQAAIEAAKAVATHLGFEAADVTILQNANRVTMRLLPCDVLVRVAPARTKEFARRELRIVTELARVGAPAAVPEPRVPPEVYLRDGLAATFWAYYETSGLGDASPADFAAALARLHDGMRRADVQVPHFTERIAEARAIVEVRANSPDLAEDDRELLGRVLRETEHAILGRGSPEQLIHGEPHPGNLLMTAEGPRFIDFETCCRGPVEFDVVHAPVEVAAHYPGLDPEMLVVCRILSSALVAAWRWDGHDDFPDGRQMGLDLLREIREAIA